MQINKATLLSTILLSSPIFAQSTNNPLMQKAIAKFCVPEGKADCDKTPDAQWLGTQCICNDDGKIWSPTTKKCESCAKNEYVKYTKKTSTCTSCGKNVSTCDQESGKITSCIAGYYINDNVCTECPAGYACTGTEKQLCDGNKGQWSPNGSTSCKTCTKIYVNGLYSKNNTPIEYNTEYKFKDCKSAIFGYRDCYFNNKLYRRNPNTTATFTAHCENTTGKRIIYAIQDPSTNNKQCKTCKDIIEL